MKVIDIHTHFYPELTEAQGRRLDPDDGPWLKKLGQGRAMLMSGAREFRPVTDACWSVPRRLEEMDRCGVDLQLICATPVLFGYHRPAAKAAEFAALVNDSALELCAAGADRLKALCQVPLQDLDASCAELCRAKQNGHVGVQIGNHLGERNLDDEQLIAFLDHCAAEAMPVLVHPWDMLAPQRMPQYMLQWLVGMPAETHLGILSLILSGALEKLPRSLKICFAHGGGNFAFQLGRVDNAWHNRNIVRRDCPQPPSSYVDRFHVDSAVFDQRSLGLLVDVMGGARVMLGSDYPFPLGEQQPGRLVRECSTLDESSKAAILRDNGRSFFSL